jgi:hypothetical protein
MSKNRMNGDRPMPIAGTPSGVAALRDAIDGKSLPPPVAGEKTESPNGKPAPKPGTSRPATPDDIWALRLLDANDSIIALRQQTLDQAHMLAEKERIIAELQGVIAKLEREKFVREAYALRSRFGYTPEQTVLQEDLTTGKFYVVEREKPGSETAPAEKPATQ